MWPCCVLSCLRCRHSVRSVGLGGAVDHTACDVMTLQAEGEAEGRRRVVHCRQLARVEATGKTAAQELTGVKVD